MGRVPVGVIVDMHDISHMRFHSDAVYMLTESFLPFNKGVLFEITCFLPFLFD
jgi:hypothetical protein